MNKLINNLREELDKSPWDFELRSVYADALEESGDDFYKIQRFLVEYEKFPLILPGLRNNFYGFIYGDTTLQNHYLPLENVNLSAKKDENKWGIIGINISCSEKFEKLIKPSKLPEFNLNLKNPYKLIFLRQDNRIGYEEPNQVQIQQRYLYQTSNPVYIKCTMGSWYIPCFDIDSTENLEKAQIFIKLNAIPHALFKSSEGHYWFILDAASPNFMTSMMPFYYCNFNDPRYYSISLRRTYCCLRADTKKNKKPELIKNNVKSEVVRRFVDLFVDYFDNYDKIRSIEAKINWDVWTS